VTREGGDVKGGRTRFAPCRARHTKKGFERTRGMVILREYDTLASKATVGRDMAVDHLKVKERVPNKNSHEGRG